MRRERQYDIYIAVSPGNYTLVTAGMPLDQVNEKYWRVNKPLEMYYCQKTGDTEDNEMEEN